MNDKRTTMNHSYSFYRMKKSILGLLMLTAIMVGCAANNSDKLHVKGNLKNAGDTLLALTQERQNNPQKVVVKNGTFEFDFPLTEPTTLYLVAPQVMRGQQGTQIAVLGVPGESLELKGDAQGSYDVGGSAFYQEYHESDVKAEPVKKKLLDLAQRCTNMIQQGVSGDSVRALYLRESKPLLQQMEAVLTDFIKTHAQSDVAAAIIPQLPPQKMRDAVALLSDKVKNGRMKAYYQKAIDQYEAQQKAEQSSAELQAEGREAPDFTLNDINGRPLKLSSLRGKYVVLDFWGSWCGWCIKGYPEMKRYYSKYKGKFEILGIDCNDPEPKWKAAVEQHQLPWLHVYNPNGSTLLNDYGIQGFPTKIVVDPQGKIARTVVGEDPSFYTYLDELFGQ